MSLRRWVKEQTRRDEAAIAAGPDCICGHARGDHRAPGMFDYLCQHGCEACSGSGYRPGDGRSWADVAPPVLP